jgi:hypothetical protein
MVKDPDSETWRGLRAALVADPDLAALVADRISSDPEDEIEFPFVGLGRVTVVPDDTHDTRGLEVTLGLEAHGQGENGRSEVNQILGAIREVLHLKPGSVTVDGYTVFEVEVKTSAVVKGRDGMRHIGTMALAVTLEQ